MNARCLSVAMTGVEAQSSELSYLFLIREEDAVCEDCLVGQKLVFIVHIRVAIAVRVEALDPGYLVLSCMCMFDRIYKRECMYAGLCQRAYLRVREHENTFVGHIYSHMSRIERGNVHYMHTNVFM